MVRVKHDDARRAKMFAGVRHDTDDETRNNMLSTARVRMGTKRHRAVVAKFDLFVFHSDLSARSKCKCVCMHMCMCMCMHMSHVACTCIGLGQSCERRAPKFRCLIVVFFAQIVRKFRFSDYFETKIETRKFLAIRSTTALQAHVVVVLIGRR